ncbi:pterin 4 alpha carbinolamine dehydratase [mine drainage metagenome]|uniref:Pterin 4 alpha carbinolamine dehydratase n=1 Tax=mine drainage metagenome TaxID=410659 RepID=A0A1J5RLW4_9ZZZZ
MSDVNDSNAASRVPQERQLTLNWRFDFGSYAETRHFLDQVADLSKREDCYPNMSFGKTYVNISIDAEDQAALSERNSSFTGEMEALAAACKA